MEDNHVSDFRPTSPCLVAGTLASLSYVKPEGSSQEQASIIQKALANPQLPTQNQWQLAWGPETVDGNLSYVATGPDNKLAYVIRGTVLAAWNIIEDVSVLSLDELPWHAPEFPDAKILSGAIDGWEDLTKHGYNGWDAYLKNHLTSGSELFVIGHSLGGMLALVMGAYFFSQAAQAKLNASVQLCIPSPVKPPAIKPSPIRSPKNSEVLVAILMIWTWCPKCSTTMIWPVSGNSTQAQVHQSVTY